MTATVIEPGEGERVTEGELSVVLLADLEQIGIADVRSRPSCDEGPPAHVHRGHAEVLYVLEGELTFRLEDGERRAGPDTWVFVPPEVAHTFAVTGEGHAHFLDMHVPSCGFGNFVRGLHAARGEDELRAVRAAFDQQPASGGDGAGSGLVVCRAGGLEGETVGGRSPDRRATLLLDTDELTVTEFAYGPGKPGADLHVHRNHADAFLVVEGELAFRYRDGSLGLPAGALVVALPNVVHGFDNGPSARSRFFNLHVPASGFGDYLRGLNPDFDQHDPPSDGGVDPAAIVAVRLSQ